MIAAAWLGERQSILQLGIRVSKSSRRFNCLELTRLLLYRAEIGGPLVTGMLSHISGETSIAIQAESLPFWPAGATREGLASCLYGVCLSSWRLLRVFGQSCQLSFSGWTVSTKFTWLTAVRFVKCSIFYLATDVDYRSIRRSPKPIDRLILSLLGRLWRGSLETGT